MEYVDGKLLVVGGYDADGATSQVYTDEWIDKHLDEYIDKQIGLNIQKKLCTLFKIVEQQSGRS